MARGLCERIFDYAIEMGWIAPGQSVVVDPFGGIGSTAIVGASRGVKVLCCELEQKFVDLAKRNFELHRRTWEACGDPLPVIVQGDSRRLCEVLGPHLADLVVSSPPFQDDLAKVSKRGIGSAEYGNGTMTKEIRLTWASLDHEAFGAYLKEQRNAAGLSKAEVDRRIGTNTAYSFYEGRKGSKDQWRIPMPSTYRKIKDVLQLDDRFDSVLLDTKIVEYERRAMKMGHTEADYGATEGQLGAMPAGSVAAVIGSPPFIDERAKSGRSDYPFEANRKGYAPGITNEYGNSTGQLSAMPSGSVDNIVSSPPYEGNVKSDYRVKDGNGLDRDERRGYRQGKGCFRGSETYGQSEGQLGVETSETFWSAARSIVVQCHDILRPGGIAVFVCKDFIRKGERVPFSADWQKLCIACGFTPVEWIKASLIKETKHPSLFGDEDIITRTERKGFFRRLAEKKGSPKIDEEDIIIVRKP